MGVGRDRISELPESLIHHILSFLPIKSIVSTTLLSTKWNNLWLSLPILDFTQWRSPPTGAAFENLIEEESDSDTDTKQDEYQVIEDSSPVDLSGTIRFMDFLDKVIFLDELDHVKNFCLETDSMYFNQDRVKEWINSIARRNVEKLFLFVKCSGPRVVPLELFYCESLTMLHLWFINTQVLDQSPLSKPICFPRLENLRLSNIEFKDKTLAMQLFSNCPVLEDLYMGNVSWKGLDVICFALPRLKFFHIGSYQKDCIKNVKVKFDTPNLLSLKWFDYVPKEFIVDSFPFLVEAGTGYTESRYDSVYNFIEKVSHVKHLRFSNMYFHPKILDGSSVLPRSYHSFRNLVSFRVDIIHYGQIRSLFERILQFSPNLTSLTFHQLYSFHNVDEDALLPYNMTPPCLLLCLKSIEFLKFYGCPKEMEVVELFLKNAKVLQTVTLGSSSHHLEYLNKKKPTDKEVEDANGKILEKLQAFSWASSDCVVRFSSP
ncbi:hypothetical protein MKW92_022577 [Papaver armeniacum]|nr:hypothetical protein MKW92_022577 [Papaver armeniacum]